MNIDSKPIINCAHSDRGSYLLYMYGKASKKIDYNYVPFPLINGKKVDLDKSFIAQVCAAFQNPPPPCT